jgi:NAD(P)-dependent dehydrogenase (short-subunit alcohol dehydrogenase family)
MPQFELRDKVVAITGAASGIGRALALALAREGAALALGDRDESGLVEACHACAELGADVTPHVVDVSNERNVRRFAGETLEHHGAVDAIVNNAGVALYGTALEIATDEFAWLMSINFWGVVYGVRAFLPHILERPEGAVVNVSSLFGLWGPPGQSAYAASKYAVRGYSESLRGELLDSNVFVLTVHPAGIKTSIARASRIARAADPERAAAETRVFDERFLTIPAETAANAIVQAMKHRKERLLIGADSHRVDLITRLLGPRAARMLASRVNVRGRR